MTKLSSNHLLYHKYAHLQKQSFVFRYRSFNPNWVSDTEYIFRDSAGIQKHNLDSNETVIIVTNEFYVSYIIF